MALLFASLSLWLPPPPSLHANFTSATLLCTALVWFFHIELTFINRNPHDDDGPKSSWGFPFPSSSVVHSVIVQLYVFPGCCRWRWLCPWSAAGMDVVCGPTLWRLLNFSVWRHHFRVVNINIAMFFFLSEWSPGTMVLFLGVQMKLLPIVFTNNNSSTPFHHFLLPPTFHPHPTLSFSASSCSAPPPWWVQLFSKLWLHGGWIWFIFAHRPFRAMPWKHTDELRVKSPILHSSFPVNNNNKEGQLHVGLL